MTQLPAELGQLSNLQHLFLQNNQLTQIPAELGQLSKLQELSLHNNQLTQLPPELGQLSNLQKLFLHSNQLAQIPPELGQLSSLQKLFLHSNQLTQIPPELGQLSNLQHLFLHNNNLLQLPLELGQLSNLQELSLLNNQLTQLPSEIGQLSSLQTLSLLNNQLTQIPPELGQLSKLQELDLGKNQLTQLPPELGQLSNLQELSLLNNQLTQLPPELGQLSKLQTLSLLNNRLTQLPAELGQLSKLRDLSVLNNQLVQLPAELGQLSNLRELFLHNNQLTQLPPELSQLSRLQRLLLGKNNLTQIPPELGQLSNLQDLSLHNNQLTQIPPELGQLSNLQDLSLHNNQLTQIPPELGQLSHLRELFLHNNQLTQLPSELSQLSNLQTLQLGGNKLTQLPPELGQLSNLQTLLLGRNNLTQLPPELGQLSNLQELSLKSCPLLTPPPEIISQGIQAILTFLQELQQHLIKRYEAKLILVGEGGTGKSSLLRSLHGKTFDTSLTTTHGIEIDTLIVPHPFEHAQQLLLSTWDFGGQHIYHATHQFFLTKRSLYLVVWNARLGADQGRLNYWLDTINALAPDSPILLIVTHTDERAPDLNYQLYKDAYPQIVETLSVSNKYGTEIGRLRDTIARYAATLPLIGQPWPVSWVEVEQALMTRKEHHIDAKRYTRICAVRRIQVQVAQGTLGSYLHDLGKILYFRDDYVLSNLVVLKPNWVTKAISLVLEDESVRDAHGILAHAELSRIWATDEDGRPYEFHLYPIFLRLMERFDLSYQIDTNIPGEHPTHSLIPQLLPHQQPDDLPAWPEKPGPGQYHLQMIYRFDFVPAGIMSWLIVRTHRYTLDKHWRDGAMLAYQDHYARVELNPMLREIRLLVWGVQPHNFFTILKDTLDLILSRFEGLRIRREVPCICHWERQSETPCKEVYRYEEDLIRRMEANKQTVECPASYINVSVPKLLYGIHVSTTPQVMAVVEAGQQEILRRLTDIQQRDDILIQQVKQLCEWSIRQFTRQWNLEMRKIDAECPNTFILLPGSKNLVNPKHWIGQSYKLHLLCQYPSSPHRLDEKYSYEISQSKDWWIKVSPWLKYLITFLKYSVPMVGPIGTLLDNTNFKNFEAEISLLENMTEDMTNIAESNANTFENKYAHSDQEYATIGPALRALYSFLKEKDHRQFWGGLQKVITPDGNILWLCQEHAQPYESPALRLQ